LAALPLAAHAGNGGGTVQCDGEHPQPGCTVEAGTTGSGTVGDAGTSNGVCHDRNGTVIPCETDNGNAGADGCYYKLAEPSPDTVAGMGGSPDDPPGAWYVKTCPGTDTSSQALIFLPAPPVAAPDVLARHARSMLRLPQVRVVFSPRGDQLVGLPTWLSVDPASWREQSATASVPGVSVTATARPQQAVWQLGDGSSVVCAGPGTVWTAGTDPRAASPDCGHLYTRSSAGMPGDAYPVTVTVTWAVTWAGAGQTGTVAGLTTTGAVQVRVAEIQTLIK
jgi:hypothetical protein